VVGDLIQMGKRVVFVIDWPELGIDPHGCAAARPESANCSVARTVVDARQKEYRELVAKIKQRNPGMLIYDSLPLFCDDEKCYGKDNQIIYYNDKDHLGILGSKKLLDAIGDWLGQH
jgi:hypothetical protein